VRSTSRYNETTLQEVRTIIRSKSGYSKPTRNITYHPIMRSTSGYNRTTLHEVYSILRSASGYSIQQRIFTPPDPHHYTKSFAHRTVRPNPSRTLAVSDLPFSHVPTASRLPIRRSQPSHPISAARSSRLRKRASMQNTMNGPPLLPERA
jgi:hypothetical protein